MPRKKTGNRKTPEPLVPVASDGLHYVRPASVKDRHPMRFVVDQYRVDGLPNNTSLPRHCETARVGLELMLAYTERACKKNPELRKALNQAGDVEPQPQQQRRKAKPKKAEFPTTRFSCIMANSVAQVWVCTKDKWEAGQIGRRGADNRAPEKDKLEHKPGEFAVLKGDEPVVDENGAVRVFLTRMSAEQEMQFIYEQTPPEERMSDNNDPERRTTTVYQNLTHSVHFDPDYNGSVTPFNIYNHQVHRTVLNPRGDFPLKFRSISGAIREADRLDKISRGAL